MTSATLPFPMVADVKRARSTPLHVTRQARWLCWRCATTFIVDPQGVIRFVSVNDLSVGRNPVEVLRVLDALQTDELCPCNWKAGDATIKAA